MKNLTDIEVMEAMLKRANVSFRNHVNINGTSIIIDGFCNSSDHIYSDMAFDDNGALMFIVLNES